METLLSANQFPDKIADAEDDVTVFTGPALA
jgi:hypothetical protein